MVTVPVLPAATVEGTQIREAAVVPPPIGHMLQRVAPAESERDWRANRDEWRAVQAAQAAQAAERAPRLVMEILPEAGTMTAWQHDPEDTECPSCKKPPGQNVRCHCRALRC